MPKVEIYTTPYCPFCVAAKALLGRKEIAFEEIPVAGNPEMRQAMIQRANGRYTVPQIFVNGVHVGGFDDMAALDRQGQLDPLLAAAS